jgi:hypothetical protein
MRIKKGYKRQFYSVELSEIAYITDFRTIVKKLENIGFFLRGEQDFFSFDEMDGFVATCDEGQVIVFRGSELEPENFFMDWRINADFLLIDIEVEGIKIKNVARGYGKRIERYWGNIKSLIWDEDIFITGHSAGGGYSTIFAKCFKEVTKKEIVKCIPHATPRITNTHHFLPEQFYTVNCSDIVTRIPLRIQERRHTGHMIYYNKKGNYLKSAKIEKIIDFFRNTKEAISNHMIFEYKKNWVKNWEEIQEMLEKVT